MNNHVIETLSTALCVMFAVGCVQDTPAEEQELRADALEELRGGLTADIVFPSADNWYQTADNPEFRANIDHDFGVSSIEVTINESDNTKLGYQMVSTPSPSYAGVFNMRVKEFPYPGKHEMKLRYYNPNEQEYWDASGNPSSRDDMYIHPNVHLYKLKFFNTVWNGGGMGTSLTENFIESRVDSETVTLNRTSDTVDGPYYGECSSSYKSQWRYNGLSTVNVGDCTDMQAITESCVNDEGRGCLDINCSVLRSCVDQIWNATGAASDPDSVHITFVDTLSSETCPYGGFKLNWDQAGEARSVIVLHEEFTDNNFVTGLAHELGHGFIGGHTNDTEYTCGTRCDGTGSVCVDDDDCLAGVSCKPEWQVWHRNLMCSFGGRKLNSTQCTASYQTFSQYVDQL